MDVYGINEEVALKNILIRKQQRQNKINNSKKRIKSALIVQGGGMRGVFSAGSLIALEKLGFCQGFDTAYGSSSGATNIAYFLSNQTPFGTSVYYEDINNIKVINPFRIKNIFDIDYLFDEILVRKKPLNISKVIDSKTRFCFFATECRTGNSIRFIPKSKDFLLMLKASCAMPVYHKPVFIKGKSYLDGSISNAIPIKEAIKDGCTDILVLLTHPKSPIKPIGFFEKYIVKSWLSKFNPKLIEFYLRGFDDFMDAFDICIGKKEIKRRVNIATIAPDNGFKLNSLTKDTKVLKESAIQGANKIFDIFNYNYDNEILKY